MYESAPWRTELHKFAITILDARCWPCEDVPFELERSLFYSATVLRKLAEDQKFGDDFRTLSVPVTRYKTKVSPKDSVSRNLPGDVDFGHTSGERISLSAWELSNQLIHAFGRYWNIADDGIINGVIVSSYRAQDRYAYHFDLPDWARLLRVAAEMEVVEITRQHGKKPVYVTGRRSLRS